MTTTGNQAPKITPLEDLNGDKQYLFAEDTKVIARVIILPDESVEASLLILNPTTQARELDMEWVKNFKRQLSNNNRNKRGSYNDSRG